MSMRTILLVDDSATARTLVLLNLKQLEGVTIAVAKDGQEALEALPTTKPDLIVSDVNMPRLDGYGLVEAIRKSGDAKTPIILLTTRGEDSDVNRGMTAGASAYLTKPIKGPELLDTIRKLLG